MESSISWLTWWVGADGVIKAIFIILTALSMSGWTIILHKWGQINHLLKKERAFRARIDQSQPLDSSTTLLGELITQQHQPTQNAHWESCLGHAIREKRVNLESGLTFLASIGVSTPFIGLLGTVWGIMHALSGLDQQAQLSMNVVAGPVAEALVATAAGLFAAIPAAMGYNLLIRRLRRLMTLAEGNLLRLINQNHDTTPA